MARKEQMTVWLEPGVKKEFKKLCIDRDLTIGKTLERIIKRVLENNKKKKDD